MSTKSYQDFLDDESVWLKFDSLTTNGNLEFLFLSYSKCVLYRPRSFQSQDFSGTVPFSEKWTSKEVSVSTTRRH